MDIISHNRDIISSIYEKLTHQHKIEVKLRYKQLQSAYNVSKRVIDSLVGFVGCKDLVNAISDNITTIFDENIRLYEYTSAVNDEIYKTATSSSESDMFYFYNNGIVFICDNAKNSPASNEILLEGASVVNGCQSLNVLYKAFRDNRLSDDACVLIRIIQIADFNQRRQITKYLNSQTPIKDSYFISNHHIIRDLQEKLKEKGYFLERQINEYRYSAEHSDTQSNNTYQIIKLEEAIQYYTGYWINKHASAAKRGKGTLFDKERINDILYEINADKVIESFEAYRTVSAVLTKYRKTRRNTDKTEFAEYLGITQKELLENIEKYRFVNTGDILLLNAVANLKAKYGSLKIHNFDDTDLLIKDAINIVKDYINSKNESNIAALTKSTTVFTEIQDKINKLNARYVPEKILTNV